MAFKQGWYTPKHPEKYVGDLTKIRYMSSWELHTHRFLDNNPNIIEWASEEIAIPYLKSLTGRIHKYYPDYYVKYKDKNGDIKVEIWEVKPLKETRPPRQTKKKSQKTLIYEQATYVTNINKWQAATQWCKQHNFVFRIISEKDIFR